MYCEFRPDRRGVFAPGSHCKPRTGLPARVGGDRQGPRWTSEATSSGMDGARPHECGWSWKSVQLLPVASVQAVRSPSTTLSAPWRI